VTNSFLKGNIEIIKMIDYIFRISMKVIEWFHGMITEEFIFQPTICGLEDENLQSEWGMILNERIVPGKGIQ
jgi:hypothetical protein